MASTPAAVSSTATAVVEQKIPGSDEIKPVYPNDGAPPDPRAQRYCDAVLAMPSKRKAECCKASESIVLTSECVRTLSAALRDGSMKIDDAGLDACVKVREAQHEGCDWVGLDDVGLPDVCETAFTGAVSEGAVCRSNLECRSGLACTGLGATLAGHCTKPAPDGTGCNVGVDTLATFMSLTRWPDDHPQCQGRCAERRCRARPGPNDKCGSTLDCGPKQRCLDSQCKAEPPGGVGSACPDGVCAATLRCVDEKCIEPGKEGGACSKDSECRGKCESGKCAKRCSAGPLVLPPSPKPSAR